jgi:glycosyltransferase involved in cell wall biosynthesis
MKGILFIIDSLGETAGGIEGKVLLIAEELRRRELFAPILLTNVQNSYLARQFKDLGFPAYDFPMEKQANVLAGLGPIEQVIKEHNVSLVQSHRFRPSLLGRRIRRAHPNLHHVFRVHTHIEGHGTPKWKTRLYHLLDGWTAKYVDAFVPISSYLGEELIEQSHAPRERVHVVWNGVPAIGDPDPPNNAQDPLRPAVAVIGDLQERKQQSLAIQAIGRLAAKGLELQLHLIGRDIENCLPVLQELIRKHQIERLVHLHGYQNQERIYEIIKDVPVFALPSLFEGVPTCIIEGMSMRKLVVTTPAGATEELVKHGENGLLHPPGDAQALVDILEKVFTTPAKQWEAMRNRGYHTWETQFSLDNMIEGLIGVYRELGLV